MRPDTIDAASELEELQRQAPFRRTVSTATRYQRLTVTNAVMRLKRRGAGLFPAAGCASCQADAEKRGKHYVELTGPGWGHRCEDEQKT
jgi:hypothetical protein